MDSVSLERALSVLGQLLKDRNIEYELVAIGGGSLLLLGQIARATKDLDLVALVSKGKLVSAKPLPPPLLQAAEEVGRALNLGEHWLNHGPESLLAMGLPQGFINRVHTRNYAGLTVHLADRFDQICFKLYASVDQGPLSKHYADLIALQPSVKELETAKAWCVTHDVSEVFAIEINKAIEKINASS
jgi:hypothetical protein